MVRCETIQAQLLDYLYDLLEAGDRQALESHLQACPACQEELARTRRQQQLLAAAARMEFPRVRFEAPPATLPLPTPSRPARRLRRWLVAAAVLLALAGLAAPAVWYEQDYQHNKRLVAEVNARIEAARQERKRADEQLALLPTLEHEKQAAIEKEIDDRKLSVTVVGPSSVQTGAPTTYRLFTHGGDGSPAPARLSVQVLEGQKPLDKALDVVQENPGVYKVTLPPDLPIRAHSQPVLVVSARKEGGSQAELRETLQLAGPVYSTFLCTDKPMYQPGEKVRFRSLTLDRATLRPPQEDLHLQYVLTNPKGGQEVFLEGNCTLTSSPNSSLLQGPDHKPLRGVGTGEYSLPPNVEGGEYTLTVREVNQRFPEQQRKFLVNTYQHHRLNKELDYNRKTYGPGDEVQALCKVRSADKGPLKNSPVEATVQIDGQTYGADGRPTVQPLRFQTDAEGRVVVRFKLPEKIKRGLGSLAVAFHDGGSPETIARPLPIVLKKLDIHLFPEGGDLVAGLKSRVYFQVRTTLGKPADLKGEVLENGKPIGVVVETLHDDREPGVNQGMGSFELTPRQGCKYELRIDSPVGLSERPTLPEVQPEGVVLSLPDGVAGPGEPISVLVRSTKPRSFLVGAYCRGRLLDSAALEPIHFHNHEARAVLKSTDGRGGVCRVTVFEVLHGGDGRQSLKPVAERLMYRRPAEQVKLTLRPDRQSYVPRQQVHLEVKAANEKEEAGPAVVMVAVVDESVVKLADDKTLRSMPTHFLLTSEVRQPEELEYADFLVGPQKKAAAALDLLLGTQGWRRFAEQFPDRFRKQHEAEAERLLVTIGQSQLQRTDLDDKRLQAVHEEIAKKREQLETQVTRAQTTRQEAEQDERYQAAVLAVGAYGRFFDDTRRWGSPLLGVVLLSIALACLLLALRRRLQAALPYYGALAGCVGGLALLLWAHTTLPSPDTARNTREMAQLDPNMAAPTGAAMKREKMAPQPMAAEGGAMRQDRAKHDAIDLDKGQQGFGAGKGGAGLRGGLPPQPMAPLDGAGVPVRPMQAAKPGMAEGKNLGAGQGQGDFQKADRGRPAAGQAVPAFQAMGRPEAQAKMAAAAAPMGAVPAPMPAIPQMPGGPPGAGMPGMPGMPGMAPMPGMPGGMAGGRAMLLREQMEWRGARRRDRIAPPTPLVVRQYAHTAQGPADLRSDLTETLYWHPVLVLPDGKGDVSFQLCDSTTRFQVTAFAHTLDGRLGSATQSIDCTLPLTVKAATPLEVTSSDRIDIPVNVTNNTPEARNVRLNLLSHEGLELLSAAGQKELSVAADKTVRRDYRFRPTLPEGTARLELEALGGAGVRDSVQIRFRVVPEGFPIVGSHSDVLEKSASHAITLPDRWVAGTLKCRVQVYPSTLATLEQGLAALLREPCGCFEQTSTSNYPNLLILDYLRENRQALPEVERRARDLLARGYVQLTSFECINPAQNNRRGYEWFGGAAPPHEALTAYGLMEFRDMARVFNVDPAMVRRTQNYLMDQRDGKGGFKRNPQAIDTFGRAPEHITNAYIVWALTESGQEDDVKKELETLTGQAQTSKDPYFLSLVANSLINRGQTNEAMKLLDKVAAALKDDGHLDAEKTSITGSGGRDLQIETTALAVMGWLKANPAHFNGPVQKAVKWIGQQRGGYGGFGSTQSTILALKALIAFTRANKHAAEAGELSLYVGERPVAHQKFAAGAADTLVLEVPDAEKLLRPGRNRVRAEITGNNIFPYTLAWSYQTLQPASADKCPVRLSTQLASQELREGDTVRLTVKVDNVSGQGQGMAVAIIGLPGGLIVPEDLKQLKEYIRLPKDGSKPLLGAFEIRGRELVLYWRDLAPAQKIEVPIDLIARIPGEYHGPASRAYLYYNADFKHWVEPLQVKIASRAE